MKMNCVIKLSDVFLCMKNITQQSQEGGRRGWKKMLSKYTTIKSLLDSIFIISAVNIAIGYMMTKTEYIPSMEVWFTKENLFLLIFYKIKGALKKTKQNTYGPHIRYRKKSQYNLAIIHEYITWQTALKGREKLHQI